MGWFGNKNDSLKSTESDPFRDLDPSLRDFLAKESPVKYKPAPAPLPPPPPTQKTTTTPAASTDPDAKPKVPPESLYQDGRFAHLWATYRPLAEIENETKTDQDKLADVFEGFKERRAQIGRAAVENCVEEQIRMNDCYDSGPWQSRLTLCRPENRAFERCYVMQSVRILKTAIFVSAGFSG